MNKITLILGPTAVGKSEFALELAEKTKAEIISADAFQVYKEMDIGTAKLMPEEQRGIPHHLIDIKSIEEPYSAPEFIHLTQDLIQNNPNTPYIITGGTGFYLHAFLYQYHFPENTSHSDYKKTLEKELDTKGPQFLWETLHQKDPELSKQIPAGNSRRVIRALELLHEKKVPASEIRSKKDRPLPGCRVIGLKMEKSKLDKRIHERVDLMIQKGLIEEVETLIKRYDESNTAFLAIGYKEVIPYLKGNIKKEDMIDTIKTHTRQFAKRQMTWFRRFETAEWITQNG